MHFDQEVLIVREKYLESQKFTLKGRLQPYSLDFALYNFWRI